MHCAAFRSFAAAGIALFAFDAHGFGKSRQAAPAPLYVQTIEHFIDDVYTFRKVSHCCPDAKFKQPVQSLDLQIMKIHLF